MTLNCTTGFEVSSLCNKVDTSLGRELCNRPSCCTQELKVFNLWCGFCVLNSDCDEKFIFLCSVQLLHDPEIDNLYF